ncbi:MAG TPA: alpha/beta hydrolase [Solirubrobacteraceae bacterium]|nr:alpha/beta hydrolase [Solirubrobacteraceae bacterium]
MPRPRTVTPKLPTDIGTHDGLAYSLWLPAALPPGGVVILHGAGSCKESHHDFARVALAAGLAAIVFDQRGHGESPGPMDGRAVDDVVSMAALLRFHIGGGAPAPIALRGSSMGGYLALISAADAHAAAVVAICPAGNEGLRRGLANGRFTFDADAPALDRFLAQHDVHAAARGLEVPVLLLHAEGDEQVPVEQSRELAASLRSPASRLITLPGGHHRSVQHDAELQAVSLQFIERALAVAGR